MSQPLKCLCKNNLVKVSGRESDNISCLFTRKMSIRGSYRQVETDAFWQEENEGLGTDTLNPLQLGNL
jgi:hypothetical protein